MNLDDGFEYIRWIRGLGGERLPGASSALPNLKTGLFIAIGEGYMTGRVVNTVTRGWVGAPHERGPFRFHDAVVGFVDRCLSRTRNLAAPN